MKELQVDAYYTLADLADWFGSSNPKYLHRKATKEKKLEELKNYADYEIIGKKIHILEVYEPKYVKLSKIQENNKKYQEYIVEVLSKQPIQYYKTTAGRISLNHKKDLNEMHHSSFNTIYKYTRNNMKSMFITDQTHGQQVGKVWCRRFYNDEVDFVLLNSSQEVYWKNLIEKYLGGASEQMAQILSERDNGELDAEEASIQISTLISESWDKAKMEFCKMYQFIPEYVPLWEVSAFTTG